MGLITRFRIWRLRRKALRAVRAIPNNEMARYPRTPAAEKFHRLCDEIRHLKGEE